MAENGRLVMISLSYINIFCFLFKVLKKDVLVNTTTEAVSKAIVEVEAAVQAGWLEEAGELVGLGVSVSGLTATTPIQLKQLNQILQVIKPSQRKAQGAQKLLIFICN